MKKRKENIQKGVKRAVRAALLCILLSDIVPLQAQDLHFSLLDLDPMLFNPAYSGFYDGSGRFGAVYRNQWASVSVPFQTLTATAEFALARSTRNRNGLSGGLWVTNDRAGTLNYGATSANAILSYFQALGAGDDLVSVAVEGGIGQVGFNPEAIVMSDGTESFPRTSAFAPTLGAGVAWFHEWHDHLYTKLGFSMRNINEPEISYLATADSRLARRWNIYGRAEWRFVQQMSLMPVVGFQHQGRFNELVYGADMRWYADERQRSYLAFSAGIMIRHGDAASINLAVLWSEWTFAFSYDANISSLAEASHTLGAFELGVVYMIAKKDRTKRALPCPII